MNNVDDLMYDVDSSSGSACPADVTRSTKSTATQCGTDVLLANQKGSFDTVCGNGS
jgi:hypothetical protein